MDHSKMAVFWDVAPCSLVEVYRRFGGACCSHHLADDEGAVISSETSVHFYQTTRRNIPEDSLLQTGNREDLMSHQYDKTRLTAKRKWEWGFHAIGEKNTGWKMAEEEIEGWQFSWMFTVTYAE
jgi:hypothetical protein